jgi:tryptophan synthase alpha chain
MSAVDQVFAALRSQGKKAFLPFITAGDPDLPFTRLLLETLAQHGAQVIELGVPYSDPIADGPVIQASYTRALGKGVRLAQILQMLGEVTPQLAAPVVTMISYAIIHRVGPQTFVDKAATAGVAGAIVPDLPVEEAGPLAALCRQKDFSLIQLVAPTTPRERALRIAESSTGFIYYVSVTGITGERTELPAQLVDNVSWLRERTELPICIGFGISTAEHVRLLAQVSDGLIVGSAIMRRVANAAAVPREQVLADVARFVDELVAALAVAGGQPGAPAASKKRKNGI